jgi:hypothetical protein
MMAHADRPRRAARRRLLRLAASVVAALAFGAGAQAQSTRWQALGGAATWIESRAWGGGYRLVLDETDGQGPSARAVSLPGGGAPELTLGCSARQPAASIWRFRIGATPPGSGIANVPGAEARLEQALARLFGVGGTVRLFNERDTEFARFAVRPANDGLETGTLTRVDVQSFIDAATHMLGALSQIADRLPCTRR